MPSSRGGHNVDGEGDAFLEGRSSCQWRGGCLPRGEVILFMERGVPSLRGGHHVDGEGDAFLEGRKSCPWRRGCLP